MKKTSKQIKSFIQRNWKTHTRVEMARGLQVAEKRIYEAMQEMREDGVLPSAAEMRTFKVRVLREERARLSHEMASSYILAHWKYKSQTDIAKHLGIARDTVSRIYKKLNKDGLMPSGKDIRSIKNMNEHKQFVQETKPEESKPVLLMRWVSDKWINHNLKWLGA